MSQGQKKMGEMLAGTERANIARDKKKAELLDVTPPPTLTDLRLTKREVQMSWMEGNLEFSEKTAQNYMKIFANKDALKNETVSFLKEAYQSLIEHKPKPKQEVEEAKRMTEQIIQGNDGLGEVKEDEFDEDEFEVTVLDCAKRKDEKLLAEDRPPAIPPFVGGGGRIDGRGERLIGKSGLFPFAQFFIEIFQVIVSGIVFNLSPGCLHGGQV